MELNFSVSGLESIDGDVDEFKKGIAGAVRQAMDGVGVRMREALERHVEQDVYDGYTPKVYRRRSENESLGTPLRDMEVNSHIYNKGAAVALEYKPTGEHEVEKWSGTDGDALIGRIEKKEPPYRWEPESGVPARPFWQNFVTEMIEGGAAEDFFVAEMLLGGVVVERDGSGVVREAGDGEY